MLRVADMLDNELITEFPCDGELVRVEERCTRWLTVLRCSECTTEISFEPDSTWVEIVLPGMRSDLSGLPSFSPLIEGAEESLNRS
jgi:hypothetical protein